MSETETSMPAAETFFRLEWTGDTTAVLTPMGELDMSSAPGLRHELDETIEAGARIVVVDIVASPFVDSVTLSVLLAAVRRLHARGGELRIACADPNIRRIFEITLLDRVFALFPSRAAALGRS